MGGGGGSRQESLGYTSSYTYPITYNELLPPWVQWYQMETLPKLSRAYDQGGLSDYEKNMLLQTAKGEMLGTTKGSITGAKRALGGRMAASGLSPSSPAYTKAYGDIEAGRAPTVAGGMTKVLSDLFQTALGEKQKATSNLLQALYTPPPYTTGSTSSGYNIGSGKSTAGK